MKTYKNVGTTPVDLENGQPVGVGEEAELPDRLSAHNRVHVDEGRLVEVGAAADTDIPSNYDNVVHPTKTDEPAPEPESVPPPSITQPPTRIGTGQTRSARTTNPSNEGGES